MSIRDTFVALALFVSILSYRTLEAQNPDTTKSHPHYESSSNFIGQNEGNPPSSAYSSFSQIPSDVIQNNYNNYPYNNPYPNPYYANQGYYNGNTSYYSGYQNRYSPYNRNIPYQPYSNNGQYRGPYSTPREGGYGGERGGGAGGGRGGR